jgi:hypothetical protein
MAMPLHKDFIRFTKVFLTDTVYGSTDGRWCGQRFAID